MPTPSTLQKKHKFLIGGGITLVLIVIILGAIRLQPWQSYAASVDVTDPHDQFCQAYYHVTTGATTQGPTDKYTSCQGLDTQFEGYIQSLNFTYGTPPSSSTTTQNWPATSLIALEIPADQGKNINTLATADILRIETALTTYFKAHLSTSSTQQALDKDAYSNWGNDPLLQLALVTYSKNDTTGKLTFADGDSAVPSITPVITFLEQDSAEVTKIQTDLETDLKSTAYTANNADCSFATASTSLTTAYQKCLGTDTVVDRIYTENATTTTSPTTTYNQAITKIEGFASSEINSYAQAHASSTVEQLVEQLLNLITTTITNNKTVDTDLDHILTAVVTDQQQTTITPQIDLAKQNPTPTVNPTPTTTTTSKTPSSSKDLPMSLFNTLPTDTNTWYSAPNNDPPGYDSYPHANGKGTYADPITFAIAQDSKTFSQGIIIYIPELEKYYIAEDTCAACEDELNSGQQDHIDLWVGELSSDCADNVQVPPTIYSQSTSPEPIHYLIVSASDTADQNYTVNTTPLTCGNSGS